MSKTTEPMTLGTMLRKLREEKTNRRGKKLTLQELGKKANKIDYSTISKYEHDLRPVSERAYKAILRVLRPTQRQRRALDRLYNSATVKRPASTELRKVASRAVLGSDLKLRDIKTLKKVKPNNDKCGKYKLSMNDGTTVKLTISIEK